MRFVIDPAERTVTPGGESPTSPPAATNSAGVSIWPSGQGDNWFLLDGQFPAPFQGPAVIEGEGLTRELVIEVLDFGEELNGMFMGERNIRQIQ